MELVLKGWLTLDSDNHPALSWKKDCKSWDAESINEEIQRRINYWIDDDDGLGVRKTFIPDCSLSIWYCSDKCTFEEAQEGVLRYLDGDLRIRDRYCGYSEYTITGMDLEEFTIGGHDLSVELSSHKGEYCWIRITC